LEEIHFDRFARSLIPHEKEKSVITSHFDTLAPTASRRGSLLALGGAGLAALAGAFGTAAKPKPGKLARKKVKAKCKEQVGQCDLVLGVICATDADPAACKKRFLPCCDLLGTCNAGGMLECLVAGGIAP
jgi:hypothetical protein